MGYHHVALNEVDPTPDRPCVRRSISEAAGLENVAVNVYEPAPGEAIPLAYHVHDEQEEVFYVVSGELSVETPEGTYVIGANEAFVVEPESPQRAHVAEDADGPARVVAVGAPAVDDVAAYEP
ncbi:cupin domain-containing protein [Halostella litorea]|uniref:cupin domain-containing protein n=1 Tax=Halostella litorea TaxID=2528831 RepID=UPI0010922939|nr:cupin domain-containing protein [Halostella litorea]